VAVEGSSFELGVISNPSAIRDFLRQLEVLPAALQRISRVVNQTDLGDGRKFAGNGKAIADAFIAGARAELAGGDFNKAFGAALRGVDLRIPPGARAQFRSDLRAITAEIRRELPQAVQIGVRANTTPAQLRNQAARFEARRTRAENLAENPRTPSAATRNQLTPDQAQRAGQLEERAYREDRNRAQARINQAQRLGALELRAFQEDARRAALRDPSSELSTLNRAAEAARQRRVQTQQFFDANPESQRLVEAARLRSVNREAQREQFRSQGPVGQARAGLLGFGSGGFIERQASILSTTASFAAGGMAFQAFMAGIGEVITGTRQFEEALSGLALNFGESRDDLRGFASEVGAIANSIGLTQSQGVEAASRSVGLFGTAGLTTAEKQDFARLAVETTGRIAQQSGKEDLAPVQTNLAGILRSFQLQNSDLSRVEDSIAVIAKATGGNQADILGAGAETATLARSAGFDAFLNSAIIANQATTTGQTAGAAAEQLAQVFAQASNAGIQARFESLGIDTSGSQRDQFQALSELIQAGKVTQDQLSSLTALFGRSRSGAAFRNLVENFPRVNQLADDARNSPGEGRRQFEQLFDNISADITKTVGALRGLATEFAQTGALDFLGALVIAVREGATALTEVLRLFNELPRPLRTAAFGILELAAAAALLGRSAAGARVLTGLAAALGGGSRVGQSLIAGVAGQGAAGAVAGRAAAGAGIGSLLPAAFTNPVTIAAIGAVAAAVVAQNLSDADSSAVRANDTAGDASANARTAEELRGAASARRNAANLEQGRRDAVLGLGGLLDSLKGGDAEQSRDRNNRLADALDARAAEVERDAKAAAATSAKEFGRFNSADDVTAQLQKLNDSGFTAAERVELLKESFDRLAASAPKAGVAVLRQGGEGTFGQGLAAALSSAVGTGSQQARLRSEQFEPGRTGNAFVDTFGVQQDALRRLFGRDDGADEEKSRQFRDLADKLASTDTAKFQGDVANSIREVLKARGIDASKGDAVLTEEDIAAINEAANAKIEEFIKATIPDGEQFEEFRRIIRNSVKAGVKQTISAVTDPVTTNSEQGANLFAGIATTAAEDFEAGARTDRAAASTKRVSTLTDALASYAAQLPDESDQSEAAKEARRKYARAAEQLDAAQAEDVNIQLERAQAMIRLRSSRRGALDAEGRAADNLASLAAAVEAAKDPTAKANAQAALNDALNQEALAGLDRSRSSDRVGTDGRNTVALARLAVADAERRLTFARAAGDQQSIDDALTVVAEARQAEAQALLGTGTARRSAAVPIGDAVAAAQAALANARAEQSATLAGTQAYYQALASVAQARAAVTAALLDRSAQRGLLAIDLTDPVAQARAARQDAERRLKAAQGPDDRDRAQVDLRNAQNSEAAAKFQQRLSDVQTAEQLGQLSHRQYMNYLDAERTRLQQQLAGMKVGSNGYRQAVDQLNQINGLIKEASKTLNGQFNIGDIKLPTIYEVRRSIQQGTGGVGAQSFITSTAQTAQTSVVNNVQIDGADFSKVEALLKSLLGPNGGQRLTTATRKA
jgi:hypothetical protein